MAGPVDFESDCSHIAKVKVPHFSGQATWRRTPLESNFNCAKVFPVDTQVAGTWAEEVCDAERRFRVDGYLRDRSSRNLCLVDDIFSALLRCSGGIAVPGTRAYSAPSRDSEN